MGKLQATRDLNITAGQWLANHNEILSGGNATLNAGSYFYNDETGKIKSDGDLKITAGTWIKNHNEILSGGNATLNAGTYAHNFETAKVKSDGAMTIKARDMMFKNEGKLHAARDLSITAGQWLANDNNGEILSGGNATLNAGSYFYNDETGKIKSDGDLKITAATTLVNTGNKNVFLKADELKNRGFYVTRRVEDELLSGIILADGHAKVYVRDLLMNNKGPIRGMMFPGVKPKRLRCSGKIIAGDHATRCAGGHIAD